MAIVIVSLKIEWRLLVTPPNRANNAISTVLWNTTFQNIYLDFAQILYHGYRIIIRLNSKSH